MERRGKKWSEMREKATSLEAHGFSLKQMKDWSDRERAAGRPGGLEAFFSKYNLCLACRCRGVIMLGPDEDGDWLWDLCEICGGTGTPTAKGE